MLIGHPALSMYDSVKAWTTALIILFIMIERSTASSACDCSQQGVSPVCGSDGLTYWSACLAECQNVAVAYVGQCSQSPNAAGAAAGQAAAAAAGQQALSGATPGASSIRAAAAATAAGSAPVLDAATINAYAHKGLRCVGFMARSTFQPRVPGISMQRLAVLQQQEQQPGATMMLDSSGVLYAAPPTQAATAEVAALDAVHISDGAEQEAEQSNTTPAPIGRRLLGSQQQPMWGARRLLRHLAADVESGLQAGAHLTGRRLKAIFGDDTRKEIQTTPRDDLYSPVGHILFTAASSGARYQCSGSLIGAYTVITAAHCLVDHATGQMQSSIEFTPGQTYRNQSGLGTAQGVRVYFNSEYLGDNWEQHDYAVMVLDKPYGADSKAAYDQEVLAMVQVAPQSNSSLGAANTNRAALKQYQLQAWLPKRFGYASSSGPLKNARIVSAGYPGDKKFNSFWRFSCRITESSKNPGPIIINYCPSASGQSGSPFVEVRKLDGKPTRLVRGLISFEMCEEICDGKCCNGVVKYNGAVRITPSVKAFLDGHVDEKPYSPVAPPPQAPDQASPSPGPAPDQASPSPTP